MGKRNSAASLNLVVSAKRSRSSEQRFGGCAFFLIGEPKRAWLQQIQKAVHDDGGVIVGSQEQATHLIVCRGDEGGGAGGLEVGGKPVMTDADLLRQHRSGGDRRAAASTHKEEERATPPSAARHHSLVSDRLGTSVGMRCASAGTRSWESHYCPVEIEEVMGVENVPSVKTLECWLRDFGPESPTRMVVLHGAPGSGKSSVVRLLARATGYQVVEMGSGDQRSRNILQTTITEASDSVDLRRFGMVRGKACERKLILMEESNSLPSSQTIGQLVLRSKVPLVCVANDCKDPRVKVAKAQTLFLPMSTPSVEAIIGRAAHVIAKEGVPLSDRVLKNVIESAGCDVRQVLNTLQMIGPPRGGFGGSSSGEAAQTTPSAGGIGVVFQTDHTLGNSTKNHTLGISQAAARMFDPHISIESKFQDYNAEPSMLSLFVQENYIKGLRDEDPEELLRQVCLASDSITVGDMLDRMVHNNRSQSSTQQNHALMACIVPAHHVSRLKHRRDGGETSVTFPTCLGRQSSMMRRRHAVTEMRGHLDHRALVPFTDLRISFIPALRSIMSRYMSKEHVEGVVAFCERYGLSKDDVSLVLETLVLFPAQRTILPPKLRSALTVQRKGHRLQKKKS